MDGWHRGAYRCTSILRSESERVAWASSLASISWASRATAPTAEVVRLRSLTLEMSCRLMANWPGACAAAAGSLATATAFLSLTAVRSASVMAAAGPLGFGGAAAGGLG